MNLVLTLALVLAADPGAKCSDLPSEENVRNRKCGKYVIGFADTKASELEDYFKGMVMSTSSPPIDAQPIELTVGTAQHKGLVGVMTKGDMVGSELIFISTSSSRIMWCFAPPKTANGRDECVKHFVVMKDAPPLAPEGLHLNGVAVPVPAGCRASENAINCNDGGFTIAPLDLTGRTPEEQRHVVSAMVNNVAKIDGTPEPTITIDCSVQGKPTKCQLGSSSKLVKDRRFVLAAPIVDSGQTRVAVCVSPFDPRSKFPVVCGAVFKVTK